MNNYDMSSTGENVEFKCFYDSCLSQLFYADFERENTRLSFGRDSCIFLIGEVEKPFFNRKELEKLTKEDIFALCTNYELIDYSVDINDWKKSNYIDDLMKVTIKQHYEWLVTQHSWHSLAENILHSYYISRGYSQGDSIYIISIDKPINNDMRKHIDNILWDSPITIVSFVNGAEYFEDSFLNDYYDWNIESITEKIKGLPITDYAKNWLINALPEYPAYN